MFKLSHRSLKNLEGVHDDLQKVVHEAIKRTEVDFVVIEGLRSIERQRALYAQGRTVAGDIVTWTMQSEHLTGRAVDLAAWVGGTVSWKEQYYRRIADAMLEASAILQIPIQWGGHFVGRKSGKPRPDSPHFQLHSGFRKRGGVYIEGK